MSFIPALSEKSQQPVHPDPPGEDDQNEEIDELKQRIRLLELDVAALKAELHLHQLEDSHQ